MNNLTEFKDWLEVEGYRNSTYISLIKNFVGSVGSVYKYDSLYNNDNSILSNNINELSNSNLRIIPFKGNNPIINSISLKRNTIEEKRFSASLIDEASVRSFILQCKQKYAVKTVNLYINAITAFLKYLKLDVKTPKQYKVAKKMPDFITLAYMEKEIIPTVKILFPKTYLKVKTILYFDFYTGIRKGEHYCLKRKDFDLINKTVKIYAPKTMRERILPLNDKIVKLLETYFNSEEEKTNAFNLGAGSIDYIYNTLKPNFDDINLRPHLMRHSYCTNCLVNGMNIREVMELMGHNSIASTEAYLGVCNNQMWDKFREVIK